MTRTNPFDRLVAAATLLTAASVATAAIAAREADGLAVEALQLPARLSGTGLYTPGTLTVDTRNRPFSPQYPLWSDGARKSRWVYLPPGSVIDARNVNAWEFPIGTKFWKEFEFNGRKVETRFLWKATAEGWLFATYAWNEEQTDATLAQDGVRGAAQIAPGIRHDVPSVEDCRACHESGRIEILGFNALQLSTDRDPGAPHAEPLQPGMVTLRTLVEENLIAPVRGDFLGSPPRIQAPDAVSRAAMGYLSANCGHCHNGEGLLAPLGLFLKHAAGPDGDSGIASSIGRPSLWQIPGAPEDATRVIDPGVPELSAVVHRMRSRRPSSQMPPLGTALVDQQALALVEEWIRGMKRSSEAEPRWPEAQPR